MSSADLRARLVNWESHEGEVDRRRSKLTVRSISSQFKDAYVQLSLSLESSTTHQCLDHQCLEVANSIGLPRASLAVGKQGADATSPRPRDEWFDELLKDFISLGILVEVPIDLEVERLETR